MWILPSAYQVEMPTKTRRAFASYLRVQIMGLQLQYRPGPSSLSGGIDGVQFIMGLQDLRAWE